VTFRVTISSFLKYISISYLNKLYIIYLDINLICFIIEYKNDIKYIESWNDLHKYATNYCKKLK
jgi:hypothetical protein